MAWGAAQGACAGTSCFQQAEKLQREVQPGMTAEGLPTLAAGSAVDFLGPFFWTLAFALRPSPSDSLARSISNSSASEDCSGDAVL